MFQTFEPLPYAALARGIKELRRLMARARLDAFLVPRADEHQGEYVPPSAGRLKWLTGFSGSAGFAILARKSAVLFVDGRYTVQARAEVDTDILEIAKLPRARISEWLADHVGRGQTVGFDPRLHTISEIERLEEALKAKGIN
jgi:Xaa-Pro aminopeptidase